MREISSHPIRSGSYTSQAQKANHQPAPTVKHDHKTDHVSLGQQEGHHDSGIPQVVEGLASSMEGLKRTGEHFLEKGLDAVRHAPHHGAPGTLVKAIESPAGQVAGKVASAASGAMALGEQYLAISSPTLSEHDKSKEVWGAALGAVGAWGGGTLGAIEGVGVASVPLGVGGALVGHEAGKKLGQEFGGWLVPEHHL